MPRLKRVGKMTSEKVLELADKVDSLSPKGKKAVMELIKLLKKDKEICCCGHKREEHIQEEPIKKILAANAADPINQVLEVFYKTINPTINFGNKTQRAAAQNLIDKLGLEKTIKAAKYAVTIQGEQYAPVISTPIALQNKIGDLVSYGKKNNQSKSAVYEPKPTDNG